MDTQELMRKRDRKLKKKMKNLEEKQSKPEKQEKQKDTENELAIRRKLSSEVDHPDYDCQSCEEIISKHTSKEEEEVEVEEVSEEEKEASENVEKTTIVEEEKPAGKSESKEFVCYDLNEMCYFRVFL